MATRVYSPAGEPFDIPRRDLADKLILEKGWTQTPPVPAPVHEEAEEPSPKPKRRSRRKSKAEKVEPKIVEESKVEDQASEAVED